MCDDGIDVDCNICQTELLDGLEKIANYMVPAPGAVDNDETTQVFRLACGHAFHAGCICKALRQRSSCPSCRAEPSGGPVGAVTRSSGTTIYMQGFRSARDITVDVNVMDDGELDVEIIPEDRERPMIGASYDSSIMAVPSVQRARALLNRAVKSYRAHEGVAMRSRRELLSSALLTLRQEHRPEFETKRKSVQAAMRHLRRVEAAAADELGEPFEDAEDLDYEVKSVVGNQNEFGPLKHRFWHN